MFLSRKLLTTASALLLGLSMAHAQEAMRIVFQNGRSIPITAVSLQGEQFTVTAAVDGFNEGQTFGLIAADHVYGERPAQLNQGIALLLMSDESGALKLLEPILESQKFTAKIPGNFWVEAARAALIAHALSGDSAKCAELGPKISEATPAAGIDPFVNLSKVLLMPTSTAIEVSQSGFRDLTTDNLEADVCSFASFFRGDLYKRAKKEKDALESYLNVTSLFPAGCTVVNAAAELYSAEILLKQNRREEAIALLKSAVTQSAGTALAEEANKRLERIK